MAWIVTPLGRGPRSPGYAQLTRNRRGVLCSCWRSSDASQSQAAIGLPPEFAPRPKLGSPLGSSSCSGPPAVGAGATNTQFALKHSAPQRLAGKPAGTPTGKNARHFFLGVFFLHA